MNHDYLVYIGKAFGVLGFIMLAATRMIFAADPVSTAIGGAVTVLGLAALIWKLVTDHRVEQEQGRRYERMLERADSRITSLEAENARLNMLLMKQLDDDGD